MTKENMKLKPIEGYILANKIEVNKSESGILLKSQTNDSIARVIEGKGFKKGEVVVYTEAHEHGDFLIINKDNIIAKVI